MADILSELRKLAGPENVFSARADRVASAVLPFRKLNGQPDALPMAVVRPVYRAQIRKIIEFCLENSLQLRVRGGNSDWRNMPLPEASIVLDIGGLSRILELDRFDRKACVQAGVRISELQKAAASAGLHLPWNFPEANATVGGALAVNSSGCASLPMCSPANSLLSLRLCDGRAREGRFFSASSGASELAASLPLAGIFPGSRGSLGVISEIELSLVPLPEARFRLAAFFSDGASLCGALKDIYENGLCPSSACLFNAACLKFLNLEPAGAYLACLEFAASRAELARLDPDCSNHLVRNGARLLPNWKQGLNEIFISLASAIATDREVWLRDGIACPANRLEALLEGIENLARDNELETLIFGPFYRASLYLLSRGASPEGRRNFAAGLHTLALVLNDLLDEKDFSEKENAGSRVLDLSGYEAALKRIFDPSGIFPDFGPGGVR